MIANPENTEFARSHRIAESLQRVLLRSPPSEALPGISLEAFYEAALEESTVGGDSFDAFALSGGRVALVVADASGKGLAAAERVAEIRFAIRAFLYEHRDPRHALSRLNEFVYEVQRLGSRDEGAFATLTLVVLNCATGEAVCLCAGGEPPLALRTDGFVEVLETSGPALGIFAEQRYDAKTVFLEEGDTVLLATDGLTEARRFLRQGSLGYRSGPFLGLEGLKRLAIAAHYVQARSIHPPDPSASLRHLGRSVFEGARNFAGGTFHDDVCLLIARRDAKKSLPLNV